MPISLGLDAVAGPATATLASVLSPEAHLVSYAWLSGLPIHVPQGDLIGKRLNIHGFWIYYEEYLPKMRAALTEATKVVASGRLSLAITTTYKPSQIKEAIGRSERGGKVLLDFKPINCFDKGVRCQGGPAPDFNVAQPIIKAIPVQVPSQSVRFLYLRLGIRIAFPSRARTYYIVASPKLVYVGITELLSKVGLLHLQATLLRINRWHSGDSSTPVL